MGIDYYMEFEVIVFAYVNSNFQKNKIKSGIQFIKFEPYKQIMFMVVVAVELWYYGSLLNLYLFVFGGEFRSLE